MPFNRKPQKFNASIKEVTIGCGEKAVTLGGENVYPFYSFDGEITNAPKVAVEISDMGVPEVAVRIIMVAVRGSHPRGPDLFP